MFIKRNLGEKYKIWRNSANILRQCSGCREPASVTTHGLDKRNVFAVVDATVAGELGGYRCDKSRCTTKAGGVIGSLEVVVYGLWHTDDTNSASNLRKVARQLVRGIHGIVATDVEYSVYLVFLKLRVNLLVDRGDARWFRARASGSIRLKFRQLKATATQPA